MSQFVLHWWSVAISSVTENKYFLKICFPQCFLMCALCFTVVYYPKWVTECVCCGGWQITHSYPISIGPEIASKATPLQYYGRAKLPLVVSRGSSPYKKCWLVEEMYSFKTPFSQYTRISAGISRHGYLNVKSLIKAQKVLYAIALRFVSFKRTPWMDNFWYSRAAQRTLNWFYS